GLFWLPIPITLSVDLSTADRPDRRGDIALADPDSGEFPGDDEGHRGGAIDKMHECATVFKTTDRQHPASDGDGTGRRESCRPDWRCSRDGQRLS
ncbi:MAG: hypothetical protein IPI73_22610, partial [Betaproteobacteria bacterium]|nr:hypothetical protein [Betaproteobacteria bacterium]